MRAPLIGWHIAAAAPSKRTDDAQRGVGQADDRNDYAGDRMILHNHTRAEKRITSYHEAGHCCSAVALNLPFTSVDIIPNPDENKLGRILWSYPAEWWSPNPKPHVIKAIENKQVALLAGAEAQWRFAPYSFWRASGAGDRWMVDRLLRQLIVGPVTYDDPAYEPFYDEESGDYYGDMTGVAYYAPGRLEKMETPAARGYRIMLDLRAVMLVRRLWPQIERVAEVLFRRKVLRRDEVVRLMQPRPVSKLHPRRRPPCGPFQPNRRPRQVARKSRARRHSRSMRS